MKANRLTLCFFGVLIACSNPEEKTSTETSADLRAALSDALTFHISFDQSADADFGEGDLKVYSIDSSKQITEGTGIATMKLETSPGRYNSAIRFTKENTHVIFYKAEKNIAYSPQSFQGTFSFWMSTNPEEIPGQYCDPIQITDKDYSNAAIWIDITKNDSPPDLRLGFFGDQPVWDVSNRKGESEEFFWRLHKVAEPPLGKDKWTHVVITWEKVNASKEGRAKLYLDGEYKGSSSVIREPFTWDVANTRLRFGTGDYIGLFDDVAAFNRPLSGDEVRFLYGLEAGVAGIK